MAYPSLCLLNALRGPHSIDPVFSANDPQLSKKLANLVQRFTPKDKDADAIIQALLVLASKRTEVEQEQIPEIFTPIAGKWQSKCEFPTDLQFRRIKGILV